MTEGQVRVAIQVLRELAANELKVSDDLAVELIDAALDAINAPGVTCILCAIDDPPPTPSAYP